MNYRHTYVLRRTLNDDTEAFELPDEINRDSAALEVYAKHLRALRPGEHLELLSTTTIVLAEGTADTAKGAEQS